MKNELHNYDIYPKVIPVGKETEITVKPLGWHGAHITSDEYARIRVQGIEDGAFWDYPDRDNEGQVTYKWHEDGSITFKFTPKKEQEYIVRLVEAESNWHFANLNLYAVSEDLQGRYPFIGDLHMHSKRSDGGQDPAIVCAYYRKHGYDFTVISDHERYYPSLEAIDAYRDLDTDFAIIPGEEVHIPACDGLRNDVHIVNFGGSYSVNGLVAETAQGREKGDAKEFRSLDGADCPDQMSVAQFKDEVLALAETLDIPEGIEKFTYAACVWTFNHIKAAGGLGIYCHPYWISYVYQVPETLNDYILKTAPFDAFEVLGGETYYEQNGIQTQKYYDLRAKGYDFPIVGSTDSHGCFNNGGAYVASTIIFSEANEKDALIAAVKDKYSVAVDGISKEYRLVGDLRLTKYACFLMNYYFPLHDDLCHEEGRLMKDYYTKSDDDAAAVLKMIAPRMKKMREKYFAF